MLGGINLSFVTFYCFRKASTCLILFYYSLISTLHLVNVKSRCVLNLHSYLKRGLHPAPPVGGTCVNARN